MYFVGIKEIKTMITLHHILGETLSKGWNALVDSKRAFVSCKKIVVGIVRPARILTSSMRQHGDQDHLVILGF